MLARTCVGLALALHLPTCRPAVGVILRDRPRCVPAPYVGHVPSPPMRHPL